MTDRAIIDAPGGLAAERFVVISGCSGGGKSTLLNELGRRGYATVEEPGLRIVEEQRLSEGSAIPWIDAAAFARRAIALALSDHKAARRLPGGSVFFDRGLIDALAALRSLTGEPALVSIGTLPRYHRRVFMAPPWPEIYATDSGRRHSLDAAVAEYERLVDAYPALGYEVTTLPKLTVAERAGFVLRALAG